MIIHILSSKPGYIKLQVTRKRYWKGRQSGKWKCFFIEGFSIYSFPNKLIKDRLIAISYAMFLHHSTIKTPIIRKLGKSSIFKLLKNAHQKIVISWSGCHHHSFRASPWGNSSSYRSSSCTGNKTPYRAVVVLFLHFIIINTSETWVSPKYLSVKLIMCQIK